MPGSPASAASPTSPTTRTATAWRARSRSPSSRRPTRHRPPSTAPSRPKPGSPRRSPSPSSSPTPTSIVGDVLTFEIDAGGAPVSRSGRHRRGVTADRRRRPHLRRRLHRHRLRRRAGFGQGHRHRDRTERAAADRRDRPGAHHPGHGRRRCPCWPTTSTPSAAASTIVGANVSDGSGTATVSGERDRLPARAPATSVPRRSPTPSQDARRTPAGQAVGSVAVTVIGRPGAPSTPQATADNATATVTWGLPPANGSPITAVELQPEGLAPISLGSHQQPHAHRPRQRACLPLPGPRPERGRLGRVERMVLARHPRHDSRPRAAPRPSRSVTASSRSPGRRRRTRAPP